MGTLMSCNIRRAPANYVVDDVRRPCRLSRFARPLPPPLSPMCSVSAARPPPLLMPPLTSEPLAPVNRLARLAARPGSRRPLHSHHTGAYTRPLQSSS